MRIQNKVKRIMKKIPNQSPIINHHLSKEIRESVLLIYYNKAAQIQMIGRQSNKVLMIMRLNRDPKIFMKRSLNVRSNVFNSTYRHAYKFLSLDY